ncbi:hypothetical protein E3N88_19783 [Mikania micrantha]|uniref:Uncharacterized protein n=1 Tax=Mikania micrantha TaxID=192012 RepID=A0A5N6NSA6_9ASTR|nr:hypothetical protein E3N88_19783 [Mikania micrantha]
MDSSTGLPPQFASTYNPPQPMTGPSQWSTGLRDCGKDCSSCCLTCWCTFISFGQIAEIVDKGTTYRFNSNHEHRKLKYRGFKPSLGWEGNLARHNQGIVLPPVGPGEMER